MYVTDVIDLPSTSRVMAGSVLQRATLLGISSAHPRYEVTQDESWEYFFRHMVPPPRFGKQIVQGTGVKKRYMIGDPTTLPQVYHMHTGERMAAHAEAVVEVASQSIDGAVGVVDARRIGSFVMACSTGYVNP